MKRLKVGVDLDGVVCDFVGAFLARIEAEYHRRLHREEICRCNIVEILGISPLRVANLEIEAIRSGRIKPIPSAVEALRYIIERHFVAFVTSRPPTTEAITQVWLTRHKLPCDQLYWVARGCKGELAKKLDLDFIVDDSVEELLSVFDEHPACRLLVFDQPWNQTLNLGAKLTRVRGWEEVTRTINNLASQLTRWNEEKQRT